MVLLNGEGGEAVEVVDVPGEASELVVVEEQLLYEENQMENNERVNQKIPKR